MLVALLNLAARIPGVADIPWVAQMRRPARHAQRHPAPRPQPPRAPRAPRPPVPYGGDETVILHPQRARDQQVPIIPGRRPEPLADADATQVIPRHDDQATQVIRRVRDEDTATIHLPHKIHPWNGETMRLPWPQNPQPPRWRP